MNHFKHAIALFALLFLIPVSAAAGISLKVSVVDGKLVKPYSGRVYVQIAPVTENGPVEPRLVGRWFNVPLIVAKDVSGWDGGAIALEDSALHYPSSVDDLAPGDYRAQAYVRLDKFSSNPGQGAADLVSAPVAFTHTEGPIRTWRWSLIVGLRSPRPKTRTGSSSLKCAPICSRISTALTIPCRRRSNCRKTGTRQRPPNIRCFIMSVAMAMITSRS